MVRGESFDCGLGANGHKAGGFDNAVGGAEGTGAGVGVATFALTCKVEIATHGKGVDRLESMHSSIPPACQS
jgi:hypothetical protein